MIREKVRRGALINKSYNSNWYKDLDKYKLEKSINWKLAIVKKLNKFSAIVETIDEDDGVIEYKDISWTKKSLTNY